MKNSPITHRDDEEVVLDASSDEEIHAEEAELSSTHMKDKMKEMRAQLAETRKERDENLAGWQRAKADLINYRRVVDEDRTRDTRRAKSAVVRALIPGLDSFESAMASPQWHEVADEWKKGIERIHAQMQKGLVDEGLVTFGSVGEPFDPVQHECMSVVPPTHEHPEDTVVQVVQRGYKIDDEIIRPAKVIVAQQH